MRGMAVALVVVCVSGVCPGGTIRVALDGSGDYSTIQAGIDAAVDGDARKKFVGSDIFC